MLLSRQKLFFPRTLSLCLLIAAIGGLLRSPQLEAEPQLREEAIPSQKTLDHWVQEGNKKENDTTSTLIGSHVTLSKDKNKEKKASEQSQQQSEKYQQLSQEAQAAYHEQRWGVAAKLYQKLLALPNIRLVDLEQASLVMVKLEKFSEAHAILKRGLQQDPFSSSCWFLIGLEAIRTKEYPQAVAALLTARSYNQSDDQQHQAPLEQNATINEYLGLAAHHQHWQQLAEESLHQALKLAPSNPQYQFNLAVYYLTLSPPAKELAKRYYQRACELGAAPDTSMEQLLHDAEANHTSS